MSKNIQEQSSGVIAYLNKTKVETISTFMSKINSYFGTAHTRMVIMLGRLE